MIRLFKISWLGILALSSSVLLAQPAKNFRTLSHVVESWKDRNSFLTADCSTLFYMEKVNPKLINEVASVIGSKNTFEASNDTSTLAPLVLSSTEQRYLLDELQKMKSFSWGDKLFPESKRLGPEELKSFFSPEEQVCKMVYGFSKPIFIRNESICLYLEEEQYGKTNNQASFSFYKQTGSSWDKYAEVYNYFSSEGNSNAVQAEQTVPERDTGTVKQKSGKYSAFASKLSEDTLKGKLQNINDLLVSFEESQLIIKQTGLTLQGSQQEHLAIYNAAKQTYLDAVAAIPEFLSSRSVDVSKLLYAGYKIVDNEFGGYAGVKKSTNISIGVYMNYGLQQFMFEAFSIYELKGQFKLGSMAKFKQVSRKQTDLIK